MQQLLGYNFYTFEVLSENTPQSFYKNLSLFKGFDNETIFLPCFALQVTYFFGKSQKKI